MRFSEICNYVLFDGEKVIKPEDLKAVSYTHLDVYKRQMYPDMPGTSFSLRKGTSMEFELPYPITRTAVSYTHLHQMRRSMRYLSSQCQKQ